VAAGRVWVACFVVFLPSRASLSLGRDSRALRRCCAFFLSSDISNDEQRIVACGFDKTFKILETDASLLEAMQM
jgi:hypothetical protein